MGKGSASGGKRPNAGTAGTPSGRPAGPRRPSSPRAAAAPGRGENRPDPSLVNKTKSSTQNAPDLKLRYDDVRRGFLYRPMLAEPLVPEPVSGPRVTTRLTPASVRHIKGAALKAHDIGLSLKTFITFTARPEDREAVADGTLALGSEMRRTLNAIQQRFRREHYRDFAYIWVAENPDNDNPHVHLLTNHRVPRAEFEAFAAWVEGLWGHGWAKIEKIRKPQSAGRYILKAARYFEKGSDGSQGDVYGNRYGISRNIRPVYDTMNIRNHPQAAAALSQMMGAMTEEVVRVAEGEYLTPYGLSFGPGTDLKRIGDVIASLDASGGSDGGT